MHAASIARIALLLVAGSLFTGCSTYVNIPPQSGDVALNSPNMKDVLNVELRSIKAVVNDRPLNGGYNVVLPKGTDDKSYAYVIGKLDEHAGRAGDLPGVKLSVIEVAQVRVRGMKSEVDIVRPSDATQIDSPRQLVTVYLKWHFFDGWLVDRIRPWHIALDKALIQSHTTE